MQGRSAKCVARGGGAGGSEAGEICKMCSSQRQAVVKQGRSVKRQNSSAGEICQMCSSQRQAVVRQGRSVKRQNSSAGEICQNV